MVNSILGDTTRSRPANPEYVGANNVCARRASLLVAALSTTVTLAPGSITAQALPFHTATAITTGFEESAARTFSSFFGRGGLRSDGVGITDPMQRNIDVYVQGFGILPYAITPMWTTRIAVPLVRKSMGFTALSGAQDYSASGIGDILVDTKLIFFSQNQLKGTTRIGIQGGVKIPTGKTDAMLPNGTVAARPLQLGSGSWDFPFMALFTMIRDRFGLLANTGYRINTRDAGFEAGDVFSYDVALGLRLAPLVYKSLRDKSLIVYLELNGEIARHSQIAGAPNPDSGGHVLFLSPDIQWIPTPWLLFEGSVQFPIVQNLNGTQLEYDTRFQFGSRIRFSFFR